MQKRCNQCFVLKEETTEFQKHNHYKSGYSNKCKVCTRVEKNREKTITDKRKAMAVVRKISYQVPHDRNAVFIFSVFKTQVVDYFLQRHHKDASVYLSRHPNPHLEILGIDTDWAAWLFKKAGLTIMAER